MHSEIYLDANATSATLPAAIAAAEDALRERYGNPSSGHAAGLRARAMLDAVRTRARRLLGAGAGQLTFTSGATEAIQTAVLSALCDVRARRQNGEQVGELLLYGATEHKAVPECLAHWNRLLGTGLALQALPVDGDGRHRLDVLRALAPRAALVCTMAANNETGVVSDLAGIEAVLAECAPAALWLVDSVQALGKLRLDLAATRIDYAPFSGHKLYAPKGIGLLYVRAGAPYTALMMGGGQEGGQRSGTENMAGIAALGAVLAALEDGATFRTHQQLAGFRDDLAAALRRAFPGVVFNMPFAHSLPTTLNFSVPGLAGRELLDVFDAAGVRVSAGSACAASKAAPSYVLDAMGLPAWRAAAAVRMSFGPMADDALIAAACARIERCGAALRADCRLPSAGVEPYDGVIQLASDGACSYMVVDAASRSCVLIDPLDALATRIAAIVRCQQLTVRAVLATGPLRDGSLTDSIVLGRRRLVRVPHGYLLGPAGAGGLVADDVHFAFVGAGQTLSPALVNTDTVLCPAIDPHNWLCSTLGATASTDGVIELAPAALKHFLHSHPDARLVDVRDGFEYAAGGVSAWHGSSAESVPLSRLPHAIAGWLRGDRRPLVFFCRGGARSATAAQCLRRLGYDDAWYVAGGVALS
jgi:cysteine desulfurase